MNLPPLPEPSFKLNWHDHAARYTVSKPNIGNTDVFTAAQMCERDVQIWNLARKQALEEAAQLCEKMYKESGEDLEYGGCMSAAEAIRSLIK